MNDDVKDGAVDVRCEGWPVAKTFVFRRLEQGDRVSAKVLEAAEEYLRLFKDYPRFAYVSRLPSGVKNGVEVDGVLLFAAEWMPRRCVAVGWMDVASPSPDPSPSPSPNTASRVFGEGS